MASNRETFSEFLALEAPAHRQRWPDPTSWEARCDWQRTLGTAGWAAPGWPAEYGGRGLAPHDVFDVVELLADNGFGLPPGVLGLNYIGPTLISWGTDEQKAIHLPRILNTNELWCQGFSEPEAGSDLASLRTTAVRDGEDFIVDGQKTWISQGMQATHMELLARTDPSLPRHKGISALIVDLNAAGITRRPIRQIDGLAEFAEVFFDGVRVPVANLLGPENAGWQVTMTTLGHERSASASLTRRLLIDMSQLLSECEGTSLPPNVSDAVVQCYIESRAVAALGEQLLDQLAAGIEPGAQQSVIKLAYSEIKQRVSSLRLELSGFEGLFGESAVGTGYLADRMTTIAGGTTQVLKNILAERVLGLPRS